MAQAVKHLPAMQQALTKGLLWWPEVKNSPTKEEPKEMRLPALGRSHGEGNSNPLQCSCLGNPVDRGAWWAIVHRAAAELDTT